MATFFAGALPLVVAGCANCPVRHADRIDQLSVAARMADSNRPWCAVRAAASEIEVASGVDRVAPAGLQLAHRHVDRKAFGDCSKIENQRTDEHDRPTAWIQLNVAIADRAAWREIGSNGLPGTVLLIEPIPLHLEADRWIEGSTGFLRDSDGELHSLVEHRAYRNGDADLRGELHQLASAVEAAAAFLDSAKPLKRTLDFFPRVDGVLLSRAIAADFNRDEGAHEHRGATVSVVSHLALASASTTASEKASALSVAPDT
jgi:hypothetical protein